MSALCKAKRVCGAGKEGGYLFLRESSVSYSEVHLKL